MIRLPAKRERPRSGIERGPPREWPRHRNFLRSRHCVVPGCLNEPIEVSHIRTSANSGTGLKPHDGSAVPMCGGIGPDSHHAEYHRRGHLSFSRKYNLNLGAIAMALVKASPDVAMRQSLKLMEPTDGLE